MRKIFRDFTNRKIALLPLRVAFFLCLIIYAPVLSFSQNKTGVDTIDISSVHYSKLITQNIYWSGAGDNINDDSISQLNFSEKLPANFNLVIPLFVVEKDLYLHFFLANNSDSINDVFFYPGMYCKEMELFRSTNNKVSAIRDSAGNNICTSGFMLISLKPHENTNVYAKLKLLRTGINGLSPRLINKDFLTYFKNNQQVKRSPVNLFAYIVSGILLMMLFYSLSVYFQNFNREFLYYAGYVFFTAALLFMKSFFFGSYTTFNYFFEEYFDFIIQSIGVIFYIFFFRKFLNTKIRYPLLEKILNASTWIVVFSLILFSAVYFFTSGVIVLDRIENGVKEFLLVLSIFFIIYGVRKKDILMRYLILGQICLIVFSLLSLVFILKPPFVISADSPWSIFDDGLVYYEIGLMLELTFFVLGLAYKNKTEIIETVREREKLKLENERQELEKQVAILAAKQEERNRISADMHDELGSGVTAIHLMSEIIKSKMKEDTFPEIQKISNSASELLNKMNTIIWTMISSNDSVESLVTYIRIYALEFFENTSIVCHFNMPDPIPAIEINGEKRRNIFLCVKEALNNSLKHSEASNITIDVIINEKLIISIADDGIGIDLDNTRLFSNGLKNMKKRMQAIDGNFIIENKIGTKAIFEMVL
ncbi:MAG TPA: sensor histidine kinase [Puia sp.]|nr:sensor histidine kinase [Puia sp.]